MDEVNVESNETFDNQNVASTDTQSLSQNANIPTPTYAPIQNQNVTVSVDVKSLTGWATFRAVFDIIIGSTACLTLIGAAYGVPMILAAIKLLNYVDAVKISFQTGNTEKLKESLGLLQRYFKLNGISIIVYTAMMILGMILYFILIFLFIAAASSSGSGMDFFGYNFGNNPELNF